MRTLSTQDKWQTWKGIVLQIASLVMLLTAGRLLQTNLGLLGLALSELLFLILAVGYTLAKKTPLKEVFPIRKPSLRDIFGVLFMWGGGLLFGMLSVYMMAAILPQQFIDVLSSLNSALTGNPIVLFFIVSIMAPICEESIERGAVLSHFRSWKHGWAVVVVIGLFFGIMHLDPIRFFNTAILGGVCAYFMVKKDNFLLPLMLHFVNNSFSDIIQLISGDSVDTDQAIELLKDADMLMILGASMIVFCIAPFIMAIGIQLMQTKLPKDAPLQERRERSKFLSRLYIGATIIMGILLIGGTIILATNENFRELYKQTYADTMESASAVLTLIC